MFGKFGDMFNRGRGKDRKHGTGGGEVELFPKDSPHEIAALGKNKFPDKASSFIWLIIFYTNDSPKSKEIQPSLQKYAKNAKGMYKVGAINCRRNPKETDFCSKKKATRFPSFGVVVDGEFLKYEKTKSISPFSMNAIHEFVIKNMPYNLVKVVNSPLKLETILHRPAKERKMVGYILLLTDKYETSPKFASLAYEFRKYFIFGESWAKNLSMAKHFKVKKYPVIIAFVKKFRSKDFKTVRLDDFKTQDLGKFFKQFIR